MPQDQVHIHCGVKKAEADEDLLAVLTIRRQRPGGASSYKLPTDESPSGTPDWLFTSLGAVNHCAVSTSFDVDKGRLQARVSLCYTLDLADEASLDYGLDTEELLTSAIATANPDIEIVWPFSGPSVAI